MAVDSETRDGKGGASTATGPADAAPPRGAAAPGASRWSGQSLERWILPGVFVLTVGFFSIARPDAFLTVTNARSLVQQSAPLLIVLGGLCVVLAMREFDLSFASIAGASGALAVQSMVLWQATVWWAVLQAILLGLVLGAANGFLVGYLRVPSFIGTLATGSIIQGVMQAIAYQTVFEGIPDSYLELTLLRFLGVPVNLIAIGLVLLVLGTVLRHSVFGRQATAIGDNPDAARIAGVDVRRARLIGFALSGTCAGIAGVLLTSQAGQYYPDPGAALLLSAYAAAFLSLSLGRGWRFNVGGALLGAIFLACVTTGVTMLNYPSWLSQLLQGLVLLTAVFLLTRRQVAR
ncbi:MULTISPECIES: ABC transporter permease [Micromonospora]|uniref:Monosaccharide ABC transporter membrane protein, CUT2 family n=1 Tax=Micromonospora yangpuensis TaxID=683228 RepID=A0A1C6UVQ8_9ACTN|nr:ABC transporter permease [Micromonospora yangpuensis]GGM25788.1 L-arabinose ABC transporter permease AraH [Micromonospora yangpuensis]SCL58142.1 monosaccharide ABC transporter membrane protein, CUT2 family [Micromonospora yangpuensis]